MRIDLHITGPFCVKWELAAFAKSFGPGQPARNAQADPCRNLFHWSISCITKDLLVSRDG